VVAVCSENEKATFRYVLRRNVVESMQTLLMGCQKYNLTFKNAVHLTLTSPSPHHSLWIA
jgi:hypothetical protein